MNQISPEIIERAASAFEERIQGNMVTNILTKEDVAETVLNAALTPPEPIDLVELDKVIKWHEDRSYLLGSDSIVNILLSACKAYRSLFAPAKDKGEV